MRNNKDVKKEIDNFLSNPETFLLFRGEGKINQEGLHFTTDKKWAKKFGDTVLEGKLPTGSKIKLITDADMDDAYRQDFTSERELWNSIFTKGYDAVVGTDSMDSSRLDVIVNPKHLGNFRLSNNN